MGVLGDVVDLLEVIFGKKHNDQTTMGIIDHEPGELGREIEQLLAHSNSRVICTTDEQGNIIDVATVTDRGAGMEHEKDS